MRSRPMSKRRGHNGARADQLAGVGNVPLGKSRGENEALAA